MVRHKRPVRGGKQKFDANERKKSKPKRGQFDKRTTPYIIERQRKNQEIENRRKRLEEEKRKRKRYEQEDDSSEEEELVKDNPLDKLLSTFKGTENMKVAIESEDESESEDENEDENEDEDDSENESVDRANEDDVDNEDKENVDDEDEDDIEDEDDNESNKESIDSEGEDIEMDEENEDEDDESMDECKEKNKKVKDKKLKEKETVIEESKPKEKKKKEKKKGVDEESNEINIEVKEENEEDIETAKEDAGLLEDPFSIHLRDDFTDDMFDVVSSKPVNYQTKTLNWPTLGNVICMIPKVKTDDQPAIKKQKFSIMNNRRYAKPGEVPKLIHKVDWDKLHIKSQITGNLSRANFSNIKDDIYTNPSPLTNLQKELFSIVNNYQDLLFMERTFSNADEIRFVYCMHAVNHALKTRIKILHHNAKLQKNKDVDISTVPDEYRDQGLVRPKILIIVPFKHSCLQIVNLLISILIGEDKGGSVMNKKRFMEEFSGNELALPKRKPKPEDYEQTFKGNIDDTFKIGIAITKKTLKLYTNFYDSDIIIASPLGLRILIGAEGESDTDYDFLASIELLILDQTDLFLMQNWDHLLHVLNHMHLQPKKSHDTDISRVRSWCVNGWTKYYRQTLIFSAFQFPEAHAIFNKHCHNYVGKVKVVNPVNSGSVSQAIIQLPLVFQRMDAKNPSQLMDLRLQFFTRNVLPHYKDSIMNHTLIYIPSYYDYVALRNYMNDEELNFVQICEYTKDSKVARARDMFFHSDAHFMLYSERAHFFHRRQIKGIRHIIFYAPPIIPHFFSEMCNFMQESYQNPEAGSDSNMTVTMIYSKYDFLQLAAVVGTDRAKRMLEAEKDVHMIMIKE